MLRFVLVVLCAGLLLGACGESPEAMATRQDIGPRPENVEALIHEYYRRFPKRAPERIQIVGGPERGVNMTTQGPAITSVQAFWFVCAHLYRRDSSTEKWVGERVLFGLRNGAVAYARADSMWSGPTNCEKWVW
jgi:hypothetical protein